MTVNYHEQCQGVAGASVPLFGRYYVSLLSHNTHTTDDASALLVLLYPCSGCGKSGKDRLPSDGDMPYLGGKSEVSRVYTGSYTCLY